MVLRKGFRSATLRESTVANLKAVAPSEHYSISDAIDYLISQKGGRRK